MLKSDVVWARLLARQKNYIQQSCVELSRFGLSGRKIKQKSLFWKHECKSLWFRIDPLKGFICRSGLKFGFHRGFVYFSGMRCFHTSFFLHFRLRKLILKVK